MDGINKCRVDELMNQGSRQGDQVRRTTISSDWGVWTSIAARNGGADLGSMNGWGWLSGRSCGMCKWMVNPTLDDEAGGWLNPSSAYLTDLSKWIKKGEMLLIMSGS